MKYERTVKGIFISRPNRFVAEVKIDNEIQEVHVKNTGRCEELLIEGVEVILEEASNPERKTKYDLIAVYREGYGWINIDSQAPNQMVKDWLQDNNEVFPNITFLKPEFKFRGSRIDFYLEQEDEKILIEVKGCTLIKKGVCFFPDAPTDRGVKHLEELTDAAYDGYKCYIAFVIQVNNMEYVFPNREIQPKFAEALRNAVKAGVQILFLSSDVKESEIKIRGYKKISHL